MTIKPSEMHDILCERIFNVDKKEKWIDTGRVVSISDGVAKVYGLSSVTMGALVVFDDKYNGLVLSVFSDNIGVVLLCPDKNIREGMKVSYHGHKLEASVGKGILGRVTNPLGEVLDDKGPLSDCHDNISCFRKSPGVITRKSVHEPLITGIKVIDSLIPIGRGQRELIIGDRQVGKTTIAIDTIINQGRINKKTSPENRVYSIYVAIGQKASSVAKIVNLLEQEGVLEYTVIVHSSASDSAALQYLAPFYGCAIGEWFRDNSMHALIVYDDLSKHAVAYRQISLLLRRPPGREAYPGDIFYLHSSLLERAAKLNSLHGSGSLTALPIVETQANDVSAYIPTNIISITDGQIFLESEMFYKGICPAVNIGLSVSRIGSAAQRKSMKVVSGSLKGDLSQFRELEAFSRFGSDLDESTLLFLRKGQRITNLMKQKNNAPMSLGDQIIVFYTEKKGFFDSVDPHEVLSVSYNIIEHIKNHHSDCYISLQADNISEETFDNLHIILSDYFSKV